MGQRLFQPDTGALNGSRGVIELMRQSRGEFAESGHLLQIAGLLLPLQLHVSYFEFLRSQAFRDVSKEHVCSNNLVTQEPRGCTPLDRNRIATFRHEGGFHGFDLFAHDGSGKKCLTMFHSFGIHDVPDNEVSNFLDCVTQLVQPGPVNELERSVWPDALDHVRGIVDDRAIPFFAFKQARVDCRGVSLRHSGPLRFEPRPVW